MINGFHVNDRRIKVYSMLKKARVGKAKVWARNYVIDLLAHARYGEAAVCAYEFGLVKEIQKSYLVKMSEALKDDLTIAHLQARVAILRKIGRIEEAERIKKEMDDFEKFLYS